ncbi:hypothetical protein C4587_02790 [Candidatus Parcubacteria bacterium]|nr:MAG: hypothetical protein C4587_02790 [Candidatus Parcubacteria bacterium]
MQVSEFDKASFDNFILEREVIRFFKDPVTLNSGRKSNFYVSWRTIAADVYTLDLLTDYIIAFVKSKGIEADSFFGVPEGATGLALLTGYKWAKGSSGYGPGSHAFAMGRGKPKDHGEPKDRYLIGMPRGRVVMLEDTATTGKSIVDAADRLAEAGVRPFGAVVLVNRNERRDDGKTAGEALKERGIAFYAMTNLLDLLPAAFRKAGPGEAVGRLVEDYFRRYGEREVRLVS